jgi:WD40 repeat protein
MLTWKAHAGPVYDLAFTPDGRHVVTSGVDEAVRLWEVGTRTPVREWPGSKFWCPLAVSPDGRFIGRGGFGVRLWSTDSAAAIVDDQRVTESVAFSSDGEVFTAHGNSGGPLCRWTVPGGKGLSGGWGGTRTAESFPTGPLAYSPDGSLLATLFGVHNESARRYDAVVILWNPDTGDELGRLRPAKHSAHATRLAFSPDGSRLAGIYEATLIVWDVAARKEMARHQPTKKHFKGLAFTPDGKRLLTASNEQVVQVWAAPTWGEVTGYAWKVGKLGCVAVSADGTLAAAGGSSGKVVVWDLD